MRHVLLTAGLLLGPAVAGAQQAAPAALSLADAIAIARDRNPVYRQALNNRGPAAWGVRNAYSSLLIPNVTTSAGMITAREFPQRFALATAAMLDDTRSDT